MYISFLRKEHKLRVFKHGTQENTWTQMTGSSERLETLHNEELHNPYASPKIIRVVK
jgi:hypothetical protein